MHLSANIPHIIQRTIQLEITFRFELNKATLDSKKEISLFSTILMQLPYETLINTKTIFLPVQDVDPKEIVILPYFAQLEAQLDALLWQKLD